MRKASIRHENLKKLMGEIQYGKEEISDENFIKLIEEIRHSRLIVAGDITSDTLNIKTVMTDKGDFGMLFTDMDEFRKAFPDYDVEAHDNTFAAYLEMLSKSDLLGFIINFKGEGMILPRGILNILDDVPSHDYPTDGSYTSSELKQLKDSIDNTSLEEFIRNPNNIGKYEELFELISHSTLLTLMVSPTDLKDNVKNGVISTLESGPLGFLYIDKVGGEYATVYTREDRIDNVKTPLNRYSQIVNFSQLVHFILHYDMDGIIINPGDENIMITRDVLLEFSSLLDSICHDSRLNTAIYHMFPLESEVHV